MFLTWRLFGSLPTTYAADDEDYPTRGHAFVAFDRLLDHPSTGPLWLKDPAIADLVAKAILAGAAEKQLYELVAWVVMANHVHRLILPLVPVSKIMWWLKGSTARHANLALGRTGQPFWQDESYDHYIRHSRTDPRTGLNSLERITGYIENNPVKAGLVESPNQWRWSSAV